jgi:quinol monooxygenase YgiN
MEKDDLHVIARITARAGEESRVREELEKLIEPTRAEPGCRKYELFVNDENEADFVLVEEYQSDDAFKAHMDSKHVAEAIARAVPLLGASPDIRRYRRLR